MLHLLSALKTRCYAAWWVIGIAFVVALAQCTQNPLLLQIETAIQRVQKLHLLSALKTRCYRSS
jgi:hypothetical protein